MAECNQNGQMPPCHKMKEMMKQFHEKCKANGNSPCEMMKGYMKKQGCVNEDGSPNPCMFMKKMMKKMSAECHNEDGSFNPCMMMKKMTSQHNEMMGEMFPEPSAPEAETNVSAPDAKVVRGDPTLAAFKAEKKQELRSKKEQIRALKKEAHQCRKELKEMKKASKPCAKVVGHLDMDERSEQVAGSCCLKTWKVKNTGKTVWPEGETFITFTKGHVKLVADGYHAIPINETVNPGEVTYIHAMLNVPDVESGSFSVVYRLCGGPDGKKFGPPLRTVIDVVPAAQEQEEEEAVPAPVDRPSTAASLKSATYEEELLTEVDEEEEEAAPAVAPFKYEAELQTLKAMGFTDEEMMRSVLVVNGGNVEAALSMLF